MGSGRNSSSSTLSIMSSLPTRMKMIQLQKKGLNWPQHYSHCYHYKSMGNFSRRSREVHSPWSDLAEFRTNPYSNTFSKYLSVLE